MKVGKRIIMSGYNDEYRRENIQLLVPSKKRRTCELFNGGGKGGFIIAPFAYIDGLILPCLGETFNHNYYTLPDGRILGLVIDLTSHGNNNNNNCNYDDDDDDDTNNKDQINNNNNNNNGYCSILGLNLKEIKNVKIPCDLDSVPSNESVNLFVHQIRIFVGQNQNHSSNSNKYVLVLSPDGCYNQLGYMIVHYLMRTRLTSVTQAIQIFANARPPGIYNSDYIHSLYTFYHEINPEMQREVNNNGKQPIEDNDVIGDGIPLDQEYVLRNLCYDLLKLPREENKKLQFPGSNPVTLNKGNIQLLKQGCYCASWKPKGTRYMMLIAMDGCYLIDSSFNFRRVQMRFPLSVLNKSHHLTLLDGEMVIDTVNKTTGENVRRYLVSDIMAINSISLVERRFHERWNIIDKDVIQPRKKNSRNPDYRFDLEPFSVRRKFQFYLSSVPKLLKEFVPCLSHEADGLVFHGWNDPYVPFTNKLALKWKNVDEKEKEKENKKESVCFLYEVVDEEDHLLYVQDKGKKKFIAGNRIVFDKNSNPSKYLGKIVECYWDDEQKKWICIRMRLDRTNPDEYETYLQMARRMMIKDSNVNEDMLVNEIVNIQISQNAFQSHLL